LTAFLLAAIIVLGLAGSMSEALKATPSKFLLYWLLVGVLLLWVVVLVFIDMLTIRRDFIASRRSILRNTIGDPELLKKLQDAQERGDSTNKQEERE
jgi:thiosulfate reductase cytochrome b subunit